MSTIQNTGIQMYILNPALAGQKILGGDKINFPLVSEPEALAILVGLVPTKIYSQQEYVLLQGVNQNAGHPGQVQLTATGEWVHLLLQVQLSVPAPQPATPEGVVETLLNGGGGNSAPVEPSRPVRVESTDVPRRYKEPTQPVVDPLIAAVDASGGRQSHRSKDRHAKAAAAPTAPAPAPVTVPPVEKAADLMAEAMATVPSQPTKEAEERGEGNGKKNGPRQFATAVLKTQRKLEFGGWEGTLKQCAVHANGFGCLCAQPFQDPTKMRSLDRGEHVHFAIGAGCAAQMKEGGIVWQGFFGGGRIAVIPQDVLDRRNGLAKEEPKKPAAPPATLAAFAAQVQQGMRLQFSEQNGWNQPTGCTLAVNAAPGVCVCGGKALPQNMYALRIGGKLFPIGIACAAALRKAWPEVDITTHSFSEAFALLMGSDWRDHVPVGKYKPARRPEYGRGHLMLAPVASKGANAKKAVPPAKPAPAQQPKPPSPLEQATEACLAQLTADALAAKQAKLLERIDAALDADDENGADALNVHLEQIQLSAEELAQLAAAASKMAQQQLADQRVAAEKARLAEEAAKRNAPGFGEMRRTEPNAKKAKKGENGADDGANKKGKHKK